MRKVVVGFLCLFLLTGCHNINREKVIAKVTDKERVTTGSGDSISSKYLIFTDKETFENSDYMFTGKFNSSDIYGKIEKGKVYEFDVYGWRLPIFSSYRNILSAKEVDRE